VFICLSLRHITVVYWMKKYMTYEIKSERASIFVVRLLLELFLFIRTFLATPIILGYLGVVIFTLITLTSTVSGSAQLLPIDSLDFIPQWLFNGDTNIYLLWAGASLVFRIVIKLLETLTGLDLTLNYFNKIKFYYYSITMMMLYIILSSFLGLGWFQEMDPAVPYFIIFVGVGGFISLSISWVVMAFFDLFIWVAQESIRQYNNPNAPVPHYDWPFKRHGFIERHILPKVGINEEAIATAEKYQKRREKMDN